MISLKELQFVPQSAYTNWVPVGGELPNRSFGLHRSLRHRTPMPLPWFAVLYTPLLPSVQPALPNWRRSERRRRADRDTAVTRGPYRKPGPWLTALRRLHRRGYSDVEIAEMLSDLSDEAILALEAAGRWNWRAVEKALVPEAGGKPWTADQVKYHRRALGLYGYRSRFEVGRFIDLRLNSARKYQRDRGWFHLLPVFDESRGEWRPGYELRRREVDILCLLRDRGP